jgi:hypothetical protein
MNSPSNQAEIKSLINQLQEKQKQMDEAKDRDAVFEERKKLFLELKAINQKLLECIEKSNVNPTQG